MRFKAISKKFELKELIILFILSFSSIHVLMMGRFWFWNITSVIPPIFFLLANFIAVYIAIFIFLKTTRRTRLQTTSLLIVTLILFVITIPISDLNFSKARSFEGELKIFNFNTEFWEPKENWDNLYEFLASQNADIYNLQEFIDKSDYSLRSESVAKDIESIEKLNQYFPGYTIIRKGELVSLTRLSVIVNSWKYFDYFMKFDVKYGSKILTVYNVHVPMQFGEVSTNPFKSLRNLKNQFTRRNAVYKQLEKEISLEDGLFIVSGDFNTTKSMGKITEILKYTTDANSISGNIFQASWSIKGFKLWRIDYILGGANIEFTKQDYKSSEGYSDHKALSAEFNLK